MSKRARDDSDSEAYIIEKLKADGVVPVVAFQKVEHAVPAAKALLAGGIKSIEVTFRTDAAADSLTAISKEVPGMLLGAGTVLTTVQAERAVACGADFLVSPGTNPKVVRWAKERGIPILPGCATPTEVEAALDLGLTNLKFFPAEALGGLKMLKAMAPVYPMVRWMPTGGISLSNLASYLQFAPINCAGGSWLVPKDALERGDFKAIEKLASDAVAAVKAARSQL